MNNELYFTLTLTENEHWIVNDKIQTFCDENGLELKYYRKFKTGHVPCKREVKVIGNRPAFAKFFKWCIDEYIIGKDRKFDNYWKENPFLKDICDNCKEKRKIVYYGEVEKINGQYTCKQFCRKCGNNG